MSSEAITRNDLTAILNEVLPFSFTEFRHHTGTITVPNSTLVQAHSETFESGSWLILTSLEVTSGGAVSTTGQNRIVENGNLVYSHKDIADNSLNNVNFYILESASNTTIALELFQATGNSQTQEWRFTAIRIGDKFAQGEADYIVEQGTSGIWTYRKWASGIAECWGKTEVESYTYAANGGSKAVVEYVPSGLFISNPIMVETRGYIATNVRTITGFSYCDTSYAQAYLINNDTSAKTQGGGVYWNIRGRWK